MLNEHHVTVMLNEVKHLYGKDSSLLLRLRSGLKVPNDTVYNF